MANCKREPIRFPHCRGRFVRTAFAGGDIASSGGAVAHAPSRDRSTKVSAGSTGWSYASMSTYRRRTDTATAWEVKFGTRPGRHE